ncbi:c-type cytochrome [Gemmobacter serpentinus]|uniref:c-type cytochrome n=1 Tax=Gemmobacter serpentinus TaxID=2652247 RepID=UPI00124ED42C|nr:cytochrome c [Gemmobacter serpentinus]
MKAISRITSAAIFAALTASAVFAAGEAADPTVQARMALMKTIGGATKTLGDMASGKAPFDAAGAEAAKAALIAAAAEIPAKFEAAATDPASEAKPEIWTNWEDFAAKGAALHTAAEAVDATSADGIKAGMAAIGGSCKACHSNYRM